MRDGPEASGAQAKRCFIQRFVDLPQSRDPGTNAHRHVTHHHRDNHNRGGSREVNRRAVKGQNVRHARHGAWHGEAQHGGELDSLFATELLAHNHPGDQQAKTGGDRCGDPGVQQRIEQ